MTLALSEGTGQLSCKMSLSLGGMVSPDYIRRPHACFISNGALLVMLLIGDVNFDHMGEVVSRRLTCSLFLCVKVICGEVHGYCITILFPKNSPTGFSTNSSNYFCF